jgi:serine/threonine-protein kinase
VANTVDMDVKRLRKKDLVGQVVDGRYRVAERLGAGGMGTVYRVEHTEIRKSLALKVLLPELVDTEDMFKRFRQEAKAASSIGHPNIIEISDFGTLPDGSPFFVMEYLEGSDFATLLKREGPLPWQRAYELGIQLCSALHAAHERDILHRDVKPDNFFAIQRDGREFVKVLDFGIAKLLGDDGSVVTRTGLFIGTPEYMSPEQAEGLDLDRRVDVYGTGIMLYQLVTGKVPFRGRDEFDVLNKHVNVAPEPPSQRRPDANIPPQAEAVILKALAKDREERQQDMEELARELRSALQTATQPQQVAATSGVLPDAKRPTNTPAILAGVAIGAVVAGVIAWLLLG